MVNVLVSCNGDYFHQQNNLPKFDYIIAVDGGIKHLEKLGIKPDIWVGDMDSAEILMLDNDFIKDIKKDILPTKKDMSDSDYGVEKALAYGADKITMIGGIGTRFDHSLFNINMFLKLAKDGIDCAIHDGMQEILFLCTGEFLNSASLKTDYYIKQKKGKTLSIVPCSDLRSLSLEGFEYPLKAMDISRYSNRTLSNVVNSDNAKISLQSGMALLVLSDGY